MTVNRVLTTCEAVGHTEHMTTHPTTRPCDAKVLLAQVGRFTLASIGARDLVNLGDGIMLRYGTGRRHTKLIITLAADDTYTVRNVRLAGRYKTDVVELGTVTGIYADALSDFVIAATSAD